MEGKLRQKISRRFAARMGGGREPHANDLLININAHPLLARESEEGDMFSL